MLAHRLPYPPRTGDKVRAYHVACHLAARHQLALACLSDEPTARQDLEVLRRHIPEVECFFLSPSIQRCHALLQLAVGRSGTDAYFSSTALRKRIEERLSADAFDLIYVSSSSMAQYVPRAPGLEVLMDFVDVDSDKWLQYSRHLPWPHAWVYRLEASRLRAIERDAASHARHCLVATPTEQQLLGSIAPTVPSTVVTNGVDLDYFSPPTQPAPFPTIIFTGAMDYFPNVDAVVYFADRVLPLIRRQYPSARLLVVGKNPALAVRRLASREGVEITGTVADVRPFMRRAWVAVAPLRVARGVQNKILEAMAMGLPVVATSLAHQGLDAVAGRHLFVEDDPARFASRVISLLRAPALREGVAGEARSFVEAHHSWTASMAVLDHVIDRVVTEPSPTRAAPTGSGR